MDHYRADFPTFERLTYLNSCSYGALAKPVDAAVRHYLEDRLEYGERWDHWVGMQEALRQKTAALLAVDAGEISLQSSLSAGLNALVTALNFDGERNRVVCTEFDFPTTAQIWHAQASRGADVCSVALDSSSTPELDICQAINERTAVVCVPYVCYRNGRKLDIKPIAEAAKKAGALMIVDAYQAVGTFPVHPRELDVDVLMGGYLKYLLGTAGMAFMYVRASRLSTLQPTTSGWFAQADVGAMSIEGHKPAVDARKFEGGTPNVLALYACSAGLDYLAQLDLAQIEARIGELTQQIKDEAKQRNWQLGTDPSAHAAMITLRSHDMTKLVAALKAEHIVVSCRDNKLRISPHFYNNATDIERLCGQLIRHQHLLD